MYSDGLAESSMIFIVPFPFKLPIRSRVNHYMTNKTVKVNIQNNCSWDRVISYNKTKELEILIGEVVNGVSNTGTQEGLKKAGLALRAGRVPSSGLVSLAHEAASGDTSVDNGSGEDVGLCFSVTHSHHSTGRVTSDKDSLGVTTVVLENMLDHVGNRGAATTTLVGQGHLGGDIPAVTRSVRSLRVDDNEAVLLSIGSPLVALVVSLSSTGTIVKTDDHSRVRLQVLGDVEEHASSCGVVAIAGDFLEGGSGDKFGTEDGADEGEDPDAEDG
ncbi:hypothetical protein HG531_010709 [Fusarium graminearum]|nr:hypothetical protein HG531_010709 [Fusarium graminearum]